MTEDFAGFDLLATAVTSAALRGCVLHLDTTEADLAVLLEEIRAAV
ncbi:hypothetical protein [Microbispora sp. H10830]|nr:hypothetical protein [Microbispora sp. H10830]